MSGDARDFNNIET